MSHNVYQNGTFVYVDTDNPVNQNNYVFTPLCISQAFSVVFDKAIDRAEPADELKQRVINLIDCITFSVYNYTSRGLFEKDKLIFSTQMTFLVSNQSAVWEKGGDERVDL